MFTIMKAYIWDLDGTLLDSYSVIVSSLVDMCKEYGLDVPYEEVNKNVIAESTNYQINLVKDQLGKSFEELKARYSEISGSRKANIPLLPNAKEILSRLKARGDKNYVYTHRGVTTLPVLERLGILEYFDEIVSSQNGFPRKPAPDGVNYLVEKYNLDLDSTYYVGDRTLDMDCAKNANIKGILFLPKDSYCTANGSEDYIVSNLLEIENI